MKRNPEDDRRLDPWCGRARKIGLELAFRAGVAQLSYPGQNLPSHRDTTKLARNQFSQEIKVSGYPCFQKYYLRESGNCCPNCSPSPATLTTFKVKSYPQLYKNQI